jgi:hypothetical protein
MEDKVKQIIGPFTLQHKLALIGALIGLSPVQHISRQTTGTSDTLLYPVDVRPTEANAVTYL